MNTYQKGEIAQLQVELRATQKGIICSRPTTPARYDIIMDDGKDLKRVQVKYADGKLKSKGSVVASLSSNNRTKGDVNYSEGEVDLVAVYVPRIEKVLMFEPEYFVNKAKLQIRIDPLSPAKRKRSLMAEDFIW